MTSQINDRTLALVHRTLLDIGYDGKAIVPNYDFAVPGVGNALGRVDLAAFSDPVKHDLDTSCIAAQRVTPETNVQSQLANLPYLATPLALILQADSVDIWPVTRSPSPECIESVSYDRLSDYFAEHAEDFRPDTLTAAKTKGGQLSFFDLDRSLFQFAYETTQKILVEKFETAVNAARHSASTEDALGAGELTRAVLQILAASILEDKLLLGDERSSTVEDLIKRSARQYGQYFDVTSLNRIGHEVGQVTFDALRQNVTFRSFTNDMLGYFYENALVDQELRKELGVYYTPRSIANRILTRLPVEDISPSDRVVFDGSSGSGNLLLAAFERIGDLLPSGWDRDQRHAYLVKRVHGVDVDPFATQVAGLSLFFIDLPAGDAWNVKTADFMSSESGSLPRPPTIVVGNPPFKEVRSSGGRREQRASLFLSKYLDLLEPGGLLGVVLPETFLENSSCLDARRRLLAECEILEMWHLPEGIFPMSNAATVVVIAKKLAAMRGSLGTAVRVEKVGALPEEKKQFLNGYPARFSHVAPSTQPWIEEPSVRFLSSPLEKTVWDSISNAKRLGDVALVRNGIIRGKDQRTNHFEDYKRGSEWRPWLGGAKDFEPYGLKPKKVSYVRYPGDLHRPRPDLESVFASPEAKVLVNSARAPGNPWRIYAVIDDVGYFPSQNIHCVIPQDESLSLEELVGVLNSSIASAWVDSRNRRRWLGEDTLRDLPFPVFTEFQREVLTARVKQVTALKKQELDEQSGHRPDADTIRHLVLSIDELVLEAFKVGDRGRSMLNKYFSGYQRPGLGRTRNSRHNNEAASTSSGRKWLVTGQVIHTDAENEALTLWVRGYNDEEPFQIPIPEAMPGWALRSEVAFEAEVDSQVRDSDQFHTNHLTNFRPLEFSYSQTEDLLEILKNPDKLDQLFES